MIGYLSNHNGHGCQVDVESVRVEWNMTGQKDKNSSLFCSVVITSKAFMQPCYSLYAANNRFNFLVWCVFSCTQVHMLDAMHSSGSYCEIKPCIL